MSFRHPQILDIARRDGRVTVDGLAEALGVTVQTIRRDLSELADAGRLSRVHGGAVLPSGVSNIGYADRRALGAEVKAAIATRAAALIPDRASVFLNIGTTTEAVAHALRGHTGLMVVTNNLNVATTLAETDAEVIVTGGTLRRADGGLVGPMAAAAVDRFKVDVAVIGCSALDAEGDLLDYDPGEVEVARAILRQSRRTVLVADASKLTRKAPVRIASLSQIDTWITDALPDPLAEKCAAWGTEVLHP
ncbi:DeoR/GlpR family DNA-binding transcription regulator [Jannaschia sp. M317]|uniref:DeoR/GlpR family DNA-binding transcription regulator n=1 Tax=Jannaschia sp. M317 TaxID=2867011 RepID=UPI0021A457C4|nr:DeoR/GlpR family DNA-binding transcription regulator [Jannaschia sp. M317]UWQ17959.1 DeoR/GlpR family DNA-binding transcription regulator [Jannaschia sp. M317]